MKDLKKLRTAGLLEGISLLVLLFIAMPLKYAFAYPLAVRVTGSLHGLLFLWFVAVLFQTHLDRGWRVKRSLFWLVAAVVPFGFLLVDRGLRTEVELATHVATND